MATRRIDDHAFWGGAAEKGSVLPDGAHKLHAEKDDGHAGGIMDYPDTTEEIERDQEEGVRKVEKHKMKSGYRY